jgi:hypothetical protein
MSDEQEIERLRALTDRLESERVELEDMVLALTEERKRLRYEARRAKQLRADALEIADRRNAEARSMVRATEISDSLSTGQTIELQRQHERLRSIGYPGVTEWTVEAQLAAVEREVAEVRSSLGPVTTRATIDEVADTFSAVVHLCTLVGISPGHAAIVAAAKLGRRLDLVESGLSWTAAKAAVP